MRMGKMSIKTRLIFTNNHSGLSCKKAACFGNKRLFDRWSWRGLNPRPNEQQKCFLHAYPLVVVSALNREKAALSSARASVFLVQAPKLYLPYPGF